MHSSPDDYLLVIEHHEDLAVVHLSDSPETVTFYQVKTAAEKWTVSRLTSLERGRSILGKLLSKLATFQTGVRELRLVSNQPFGGKLSPKQDPNSSTLPLGGICASELNKLQTKISKELGALTPGSWQTSCMLDVADLAVNDHSKHTTGKLAMFAEAHGHSFPVVPTYKALAAEIIRRSEFEANPASIEELLKRRCISRREFTQLLSKADAYSKSSSWAECDQELRTEGVSFVRRQELKQAWRRHQVSLLDPTLVPVRVLQAEIRTAYISTNPDAAQSFSALATDLASKIAKRPVGYEDVDVLVAVMYEILNVSQESDSAPGPQLEKGST